jgi:DNA-binding response OmpR family regulator
MSRILLVEDDPVTATILGRAPDQSGHEVEIAKNGPRRG